MFWFVFCRTNLTGNRLRPSPQDTYRYGKINITRTIRLASSARQIKGNQRYAVNRASFYPSDTPLKLADYFKIDGVYTPGNISDQRTKREIFPVTFVMQTDFGGCFQEFAKAGTLMVTLSSLSGELNITLTVFSWFL